MAGKLGGWQPTQIDRFIESRDTACSVMLVDTDAGRGYLKAMGNPAGNHSLVCEWLGTNLARRLGLSTFDMALIDVEPEDVLYFARGGRAAAGPAVISRAEAGQGWGGSVAELRGVENSQQIARVVVLDTWLRNHDRHHPSGTLRNYDNVFLSVEARQAGKLALRAIDHSHCLMASPTPIVTLKAPELESSQETIQTEEQLRRFIESRANEIRITPPRYIKVRDCEQQLDELFAELIGEERMVACTEAPDVQPETMLLRRIQQSGLERKIEQNVVIEVPFVKKRRLMFPLAYQNDRFHVLRSERFQGGGNADPAKKAYRHAVEGRFLFEHPDRKLGDLQLVVVGEFESVDEPQVDALRDLLGENRTTLYTTKELPKLVDEIRTHAKDLR